MTKMARLAVAGAGLIGQRHIAAILANDTTELGAVVDPSEPAQRLASDLDVSWYPDLDALFQASKIDGVVISTPNQLHVENGLQCVAAGVPALIEKPLAVDLAGATSLVEAAEASGIALLVGHHRRHNPLIASAKAHLEAGRIGEIVSVHGMFWLMKPDDYFQVEWRRAAGAGPVYINLIHDIDLLRHLVDEVVSVHALTSNRIRGHAVEDSCAIMLKFANGALGTVNVSDTIVAPWSWELSAGENPAYPNARQHCYLIGGTKGSLELPSAKLWQNPGPRSWWEPISATVFPVANEDPLLRQIRQFARVITANEAPLVPASEGLKTLQVIDAIMRSAETAETVHL
tara:strand:+ start:5080 stop:6114 length:1035 start_codon:yes stop_codon:yes gene_type:complete